MPQVLQVHSNIVGIILHRSFALTDLEIIKQIQENLHAKFIWASDRSTYGVIESWDNPQDNEHGYFVDDCDGYSIRAWHECRDAGISKDKLSLAVCRTEVGQRTEVKYDHAVLLVKIDDNYMCLDNRYRQVWNVIHMGYDHWMRSQSNITDSWVKMEIT